MIEENVLQISGEITINVDVSVKNIICVKEIIFATLATCSCENGKYLASIIDHSVITCDEIIESYNKETKNFQQILMKRKQPVKRKISIFCLLLK